MAADWPYLLLRASLLLSVSSVAVWLLARWQPVFNPRWHRAAWAFVLAQGLFLFPGVCRVTLPAWVGRLVVRPQAQSGGAHDLSSLVHAPASGNGVAGHDEAGVPADAMGEQRGHHSAAAVGHELYASLAGAGDEQGPAPGAGSSEAGLLAGSSRVVRRGREPAAGTPTSVAAGANGTKRLAGFDGGDSAREHLARQEQASADGRTLGGTLGVSLGGSPAKWALMVWFFGALGVALMLLVNYLLLLGALRRCRPAPAAWARELKRLCLELEISQRVRLEVHARLGPFLCWAPGGPRVVVPVRLWSRLSASQRLAVLHHELCHLRRGDLWKSLLAWVVVNVHWFNPLAWLAARHFDESAEWSCDALLAREAPCRVPALAKALIAAARGGEVAACGAIAVSGGPVYRRIRRILAGTFEGDGTMRKIHWSAVLAVAALVAALRPEVATLGEASAAGQREPAARNAASEQETLRADQAPHERQADQGARAAEGEATGSDPRLDEFASRIVVGEDERLQQFVRLLQTEAGRVVMADRAALAAQSAASEEDAAALWETFVAGRFAERGEALAVADAYADEMAAYIEKVERGNAAAQEMAGVFREVGTALETNSDTAAMLKRFLLHDAACAAVYYHELRSSLHPDVDDLVEELGEMLVRTGEGRFVVRPARRPAVAQWLTHVEQRSEVLSRLHQELNAWADDLVNEDALHRRLKELLRSRPFAEYLATQVIEEGAGARDEDVEGIFWQLEEATDDVAAGLRLNQESEACRELLADVERFAAMWRGRDALREPLGRLIERLEEQDELHRRLRDYLKTDTALVWLMAEMDYLPRSPAEAAREWLSYRVTKNENGQYTLTAESPEDLANELGNFFTEFREIRRRGRTIDAFAARLADPRLKQAMQSFLGKLMLRDLVQQAGAPQEVDGLQLWIDQHFEETAEGLVLQEWAGDVIAELLAQAAELEAQLQQVDF